MGNAAPAGVIALQRAVGNRATAAMLGGAASAPRRAVARCAGTCTCGGKCGAGRPDEELEALGARAIARSVMQRQALQRMAPCPPSLADSDPTPPGWRSYPGSTEWFHCGFRTILENRDPTPADPMNECVYDHSGTLVDDSHRYASCKGTPDQYDSRTNKWKHTFNDSGGIWQAGGPAFVDSRVHEFDESIGDPVLNFFSGIETGIKRLYGAP
jgi:hypothetical protein